MRDSRGRQQLKQMADDIEQSDNEPAGGEVGEITPKSENFSRWYIDVVRRAELADYTPVKGCMVIRPYGYGIWENTRDLILSRPEKRENQSSFNSNMTRKN